MKPAALCIIISVALWSGCVPKPTAIDHGKDVIVIEPAIYFEGKIDAFAVKLHEQTGRCVLSYSRAPVSNDASFSDLDVGMAAPCNFVRASWKDATPRSYTYQTGKNRRKVLLITGGPASDPTIKDEFQPNGCGTWLARVQSFADRIEIEALVSTVRHGAPRQVPMKLCSLPEMPSVIVIAGPNGAGKSTLAPALLRHVFGNIEFLNADTIAAALASSSNVNIKAGKKMLRRYKELSVRAESFAVETTLSGRSYARSLKRLNNDGYTVQIAFLWLPDVELSIQRVAERVRRGGHDIPESTIRRRFSRGLKNFLTVYKPLADAWRVYDASNEQPVMVAFGDKIAGETIVEKSLWASITE